MDVVLGASGCLGRALVDRLLKQGRTVRALSRTPERHPELTRLGAQVVGADLRKPLSVAAAVQGAERVFDCAQAFAGPRGNACVRVDLHGKYALLDAVDQSSVQRLVFFSAVGAREDHPIDFYRYKALVERRLRTSVTPYTVVRATPFMDSWAPICARQLIGLGRNPVNLIAASDVAEFVLAALRDGNQREVLEIGGPENIALQKVAVLYRQQSGLSRAEHHWPAPLARLAARALWPLNPSYARTLAVEEWMESRDMSFDASEVSTRFRVTLTRLEEFLAGRERQSLLQQES